MTAWKRGYRSYGTPPPLLETLDDVVFHTPAPVTGQTRPCCPRRPARVRYAACSAGQAKFGIVAGSTSTTPRPPISGPAIPARRRSSSRALDADPAEVEAAGACSGCEEARAVADGGPSNRAAVIEAVTKRPANALAFASHLGSFITAAGLSPPCVLGYGPANEGRARLVIHVFAVSGRPTRHAEQKPGKQQERCHDCLVHFVLQSDGCLRSGGDQSRLNRSPPPDGKRDEPRARGGGQAPGASGFQAITPCHCIKATRWQRRAV